MSACTAEQCDTKLADGIHLCHEHTERLEYQLAEVDTVWDDLQTTMARMDKGAPSVGSGGGAGSRPPVNLDALEHGQQLRVVLAGWASMIDPPTAMEPSDLSTWLMGVDQIAAIRGGDWAGDMLRELTTAMRDCRHATDRAAERVTVGPCGNADDGTECPGTMTATHGNPFARCRICGATVSVHERQSWMIDQSWHVRRPLPDILRALKVSGHLSIPVERVKKWTQRGKLAPAICDVRTRRELYTPAAVMEAYRKTPAGKRLTGAA